MACQSWQSTSSSFQPQQNPLAWCSLPGGSGNHKKWPECEWDIMANQNIPLIPKDQKADEFLPIQGWGCIDPAMSRGLESLFSTKNGLSSILNKQRVWFRDQWEHPQSNQKVGATSWLRRKCAWKLQWVLTSFRSCCVWMMYGCSYRKHIVS